MEKLVVFMKISLFALKYLIFSIYERSAPIRELIAINIKAKNSQIIWQFVFWKK